MKLSWKPFTLELRHTFTLATSSRSTTPVVLTRLEYEGISGYGEASLPPYLGESQASVQEFLAHLNLEQFRDPFQIQVILEYVDTLAPGNCAAKAAVDIALHDLVGKLLNQPWYRIWGLDKAAAPATSFTIGIDTPGQIRKKLREATGFRILKVKLGRENDREIIETIRSVSDIPMCVDVNQGWNDRDQALDMIHWLSKHQVLFVEQPLPKNRIDDLAWIKERSPLPLIADEGLQRLGDVLPAQGVYHGINIKLMKCTGLREAYQMITLAHALGLQVMLGCMTETSCAVSAASQLAPLADWADLDGNLLISNDPFVGIRIVDGQIVPPSGPGIGAHPLRELF